MPIPVTNFPIPTFQQAVPALAGARAGTDIMSGILANQATQQQAQYQPQTMQEQLEAMKAKTALTQEQTRFTPLEYALRAQQTQQTGGRFGPAYQLYRAVIAMPPATRAQWMAQNQEQWNAVINTLGTQAMPQPPSAAQQAVTGEMARMFPQAQAPAGGLQDQLQQLQQQQQPQPQQPQPQQPQPQPQQPQPQPQQPQPQQPQAAGFVSTPEQIEKLKLSNRLAANQKSVVPQISKRAQNAVVMENNVYKNRDEYAKRINNALQYAGAYGKSKRYAQSWLNENPEGLSDYDWFDKTFTTVLSNMQRLMEGMGATDAQKTELRSMINDTDNLLTNPERAKKSLNKMFRMWSQLADSTYNAAEPLNKGIYRKQADIPPIKGDYLNGGAGKKVISAPAGGKTETVKIRLRDGRSGVIPKEDLQDAISTGATEVK